jgi:hypothetical protein
MAKYTARYNNRTNKYGNAEIELCLLENVNGDMLATKLLVRGDLYDIRRYCRQHKIDFNTIIWGDPVRDTSLVYSRKYGFSQA